MFVSVLGKKIHYQIIDKQWIEQGKPLLVFLHEGLGSIPQWKRFPEKLSERLQLPALVYERVGYGQSDYWQGPLSAKFLYFEGLVMLPNLIEELSIENDIILFGHSDGGTIALIQCSQPMSQLKAAIVEAPHVFLEQHSLDGIAKVRTMLDNEEFIHVMNRFHYGRAAKLVDNWSSHWLKANPSDWEAGDILKQIDKPLLLIQGENDEFGTFEQIDKVAREARSKHIEVAKLEDCGHIPHLQKIEKVMQLTEEFINKLY